MPTVQVNDAELYYEEHGSGSEAIVFVHGFFASSKIWRESYISRLPPKYRAYAIDLRGHGRSSQTTGGCNLIQLADDVFRWAQQLHIAPFHHVGVSMGGGVGIQLALEHPEVLRSLIVMNTVTGFGLIAPRLAVPLLTLMAGRRWLLRKMLRKGFTRPPPSATLQLLLDDALLVSKQTCAGWFHRNNRMRHFDRLHGVETPTFVMIGGRDTVLPVGRQHRLAEMLPHAEKVVFEDAGHMMALEIPHDVFEAMNGFLERGS